MKARYPTPTDSTTPTGVYRAAPGKQSEYGYLSSSTVSTDLAPSGGRGGRRGRHRGAGGLRFICRGWRGEPAGQFEQHRTGNRLNAHGRVPAPDVPPLVPDEPDPAPGEPDFARPDGRRPDQHREAARLAQRPGRNGRPG